MSSPAGATSPRGLQRWPFEAILFLGVGPSLLLFAGVPTWVRLSLAGLAVTAALALFVEGRASDLRLSSAPLFWPALVWLLWSLAAALPVLPGGAALSIDRNATLIAGSALAVFWLFHQCAWVVLLSARARERFLAFLTALGGVVSLVAMTSGGLQTRKIYWVFEPFGDSAPYGPFWSRNHYATYMAMLAPLALRQLIAASAPCHGFYRSRQQLRACLHHLGTNRGATMMATLFASVLMMTSVVASRSRGGILALLLGIATIVWGRRAWALLLPAGIAVAVGVSQTGSAELANRFLLDADSGRLEVWSESLRALQSWRWLTGYGLGTYSLAVPKAVAQLAQWGIKPGGSTYAHNDYLQVLVENGVPGLALVLWGVGAALWKTREDRFFTAAILAGAFHALFDFSFHIPAVAVLAAAVAAGSASQAASERTKLVDGQAGKQLDDH